MMARGGIPEGCDDLPPAYGSPNRKAKGSYNPRYANGHRRRVLRQRVAAQGLPCAICGRPIDYSLPAGHPMSYELDEVVPVSRGGSPTDPRNVQPAHRICNERKGAGAPKGVSNRSGGAAARKSGLPFSRDW